jgi:hypothetical protein
MAFDFTKPRFLLCEGDDDKGFLEALIRARGLPEFQVCHAAECNAAGPDGRGIGGRSGFRHSLDSGIQVLSGFGQLKAILIVSDNDSARSFRDVQDELRAVGQTPPARTSEVGSIFGKPLAIFMVPNANLFGDLESLALPAIHQKWPKARMCVPLFLKCTGALKYFGGAKWTKRASVSKARARAAAVGFNEDDPYKGIGYLFKNGTLSARHGCFDGIAEFLQNFDTLCGI